MPIRSIAICVSEAALADALAKLIAPLAPVRQASDLRDVCPRELLIASTSRCSTDECAALAQMGIRAVILAALSSDFEERSFLEAGAAGYLPMVGDARKLRELVRELLTG